MDHKTECGDAAIQHNVIHVMYLQPFGFLSTKQTVDGRGPEQLQTMILECMHYTYYTFIHRRTAKALGSSLSEYLPLPWYMLLILYFHILIYLYLLHWACQICPPMLARAYGSQVILYSPRVCACVCVCVYGYGVRVSHFSIHGVIA